VGCRVGIGSAWRFKIQSSGRGLQFGSARPSGLAGTPGRLPVDRRQAAATWFFWHGSCNPIAVSRAHSGEYIDQIAKGGALPANTTRRSAVSRSHGSLTGRCLVGRRRQVTADDPERNGNCCRGSTGGKMVTNRPSMPILGIGGRCSARQQNLFLMKT
jgi:hypothetical protein